MFSRSRGGDALGGSETARQVILKMTSAVSEWRLHSHRYQLTPEGLRIALFFSRTYARLLRPKLAEIMPQAPPTPSALRAAFDRLNSAIDACCEEQRLAA